MARLDKAGLEAYVSSSLDASLPSASALTIQQIREAVADTIKEGFRNLPNVSTAEGFIFQVGSDPDNWFDMTLKEIGEGGYDNQGWDLIPMISGNGTQTNPTAGGSIPSPDFDGIPEIKAGTGSTENMSVISYTGQYHVSGMVLAEPASGQSNRQIDLDLAIFNSSGTLKSLLQLETTVNSSPAGKADTLQLLAVTIKDPVQIVSGDAFGMVIRKNAGEPSTDVTIQKCAMNVTLIGLG